MPLNLIHWQNNDPHNDHITHAIQRSLTLYNAVNLLIYNYIIEKEKHLKAHNTPLVVFCWLIVGSEIELMTKENRILDIEPNNILARSGLH